MNPALRESRSSLAMSSPPAARATAIHRLSRRELQLIKLAGAPQEQFQRRKHEGLVEAGGG
jgi:hypothetical protein